MKRFKLYLHSIYLLTVLLYQCTVCFGQECKFVGPIVKIDFGNADQPSGINLSLLKNYREEQNGCPNDGSYTFSSSIEDCFLGHWLPLFQDHTPGDIDGKMLVMNASHRSGLCFMVVIDGLKPTTKYELGTWIANICNPLAECTQLRPNLLFILSNESGKEFAKFTTGKIEPNPTITWLQHSGIFTTPAGTTRLVLNIVNQEDGGCGNDFAIDDITLLECVYPKAEKPIVPVVQKQKNSPNNNQPKLIENPAVLPPKKEQPDLARVPEINTSITKITARPRSTIIPTPSVLLTRENPVIKKIFAGAEELLVELYDNGDIDGDSVSVYHNNKMIVSRAALSDKPISFNIKVAPEHPHHELVMVANNLGSIPPNTSVMIITARNRRHDIFISSSEQKNAKITIDLQQ